MIRLDPDQLGSAAMYRLLIGGVIPRPIATVSTISADGVANVAPFSFYNAVSSDPPCLMIAVARKSDGSKKDTLLNIEATGQFVVNATPVALARQINEASADYPHGVSEFQKAGLTPAPSLRVRPPRVAESPLSFECEIHGSLEVGGGKTPGSTTLILGRIVFVTLAEDLYKDGRIDPVGLDPLSRLGGSSYGQTSGIFELPRPRTT